MVTNKISIEKQNSNNLDTTIKEVEKITPNTTIQYIYKNNDMLTKTTAQKASNSLIGLTKEELISTLNDVNITEFSDNLVVIEKNTYDYNPHFIVGDNNGYVSIFYCDKNNNITLYNETNILTKTLPDEDIKMLNKGIKAEDNKELIKIIEDYTS